ncbi:TetR family transcriptional regulator C-terminal domain-containing protein [uncultured Kiloniella sp.]|uniref:TetR/AcrR family transcriptional regulator n=1 Tax=Kiloniella sp. TaxID=1938587 RepID=UPI00260A821B|nr:TetR family transcriptional regulator C-terminal domain-containing protein [uncultured Kiloniella sp.]
MQNAAASTPKFRRLEADFRRQRLIDATVKCIAEHGYAATSVRQICSKADVSPGLLRHYFTGKSDLILQAYAQLIDKFSTELKSALDDHSVENQDEKDDPRNKLKVFVNTCFNGTMQEETTLSVMLAFWSELRLDPMMQSNAKSLCSGYHQQLVDVISDVALNEGNQDEVDPSLVALALAALVDGLWLQMCINRSTFSINDARLACFGLLDGFLFCGTNEQWLQVRAAGRLDQH